MGVLKLSVIEEQNKQLKNRLRVVGQKRKCLSALATVIVLVSVSSEKAKLQCATMLPLLEVGTLIKESLIKGEPLFNTLAFLILRIWKL